MRIIRSRLLPTTMMRSRMAVRSARYGYHQLEEMALRAFELDRLERHIARCLLAGMTYDEAAEAMHLSKSTIKGNARIIFEKTSATDRAQFERRIHHMIERL